MRCYPNRSCKAFTLIELVIATAIAAMVIGGSVYGYIISSKRAEWSAYSLAAHSMAMQRIEQARAAKWDPSGFPPVDNLTNGPPVVDVLDIPISGTNIAYATSVTTIATISVDPPLKKIRVETVWPFVGRGAFTNTIVTYRAADQ
jgi:prepilin-type N-terminal cleavage/methylation domain-containing protein